MNTRISSLLYFTTCHNPSILGPAPNPNPSLTIYFRSTSLSCWTSAFVQCTLPHCTFSCHLNTLLIHYHHSLSYLHLYSHLHLHSQLHLYNQVCAPFLRHHYYLHHPYLTLSRLHLLLLFFLLLGKTYHKVGGPPGGTHVWGYLRIGPYNQYLSCENPKIWDLFSLFHLYSGVTINQQLPWLQTQCCF